MGRLPRKGRPATARALLRRDDERPSIDVRKGVPGGAWAATSPRAPWGVDGSTESALA